MVGRIFRSHLHRPSVRIDRDKRDNTADMTSLMIDARYMAPGRSGIGRYTERIVDAIQHLRPTWDYRLIVRKHGDERHLRANRIVRFNAWSYGARTTFVLPFLLGTRPADLFHSPFAVMPLGLACPAIVTVHDLFGFDAATFSNYPFPIGWLESAYFRPAIADTVRRARRVICVSQTTADELLVRVPASRGKVRVVHHGVDPSFRVLEDREAVARRCASLTGSPEPFIFCLGGALHIKNLDGMLKAFAAAFPGDRGPRLVIASRLGRHDTLQRLSHSLGVTDRLVLLEHPSDDDVLALFNGALFFAFISRVEGFGLPILEAMACGCPVITSNRSCLPEVAGDAAILADPTDVGDMARHMKRLADNSGLRDELRTRGFERAAGFTWRRAAERTIEVYDEVLAAG